ncbi:LOW QUALITY PROTEIN: hypothetical protein QYF61_019299 [Mycteria americana]|uniref:G-protein coupled receptors family 1 profile domain-containing protein n=1 Tax=Mycteria americana TaxID=33587 RepID=A0AAN7N427_MYCAM|nr:LOW QUALITY PROTEIN: hypothetical protein QYF61_019299 [Mycteria americana]
MSRQLLQENAVGDSVKGFTKVPMEFVNNYLRPEFILLGFGNGPELDSLLFLMFLSIYIVTITGNIFITVLMVANRHLHTPMYFFLGDLACLEICYSSNILPRMLLSYLGGDRSILVNGCFTQYYFFGCLAAAECYLLAVMSYDRYLAACKPLHYPSHMNSKLCLQLGAASWISGFLSNSMLTFQISNLDFRGPNEIEHFFCDSFPMIKLSCGDTHVAGLVILLCVLTASISFDLLILSLHYYHHHENSSCHWKETGLFHLLLPSYCGDSFLLVNINCLCTSSSRYPNISKVSLLCFLYHSHSLGQSSHLQSEKHRSKGSSAKTDKLFFSCLPCWLVQAVLFLFHMEAVEAPGLRNQTSFTLQGFSHLVALQVFLFKRILLMFLITMTRNFLIIKVAAINSALHAPVYYFLKNMALIEICFTLNIVPKMLVDLSLEGKVVSFSACALQLYFVKFFVTSECFLLGATAYDRYMAICHPLHYTITMNRESASSYGHSMLDCWYSAFCRTHWLAI